MGKNRNRNRSNNQVVRNDVDTVLQIIRENSGHRRLFSLLADRGFICSAYPNALSGAVDAFDTILTETQSVTQADLTVISKHVLRVLGSLRNYHNDLADHQGFVNAFIDCIRDDNAIYEIDDYIVECVRNLYPDADRVEVHELSYTVMLYEYANMMLDLSGINGTDEYSVAASSSTTEKEKTVEESATDETVAENTSPTNESDPIAKIDTLANRIVTLVMTGKDDTEYSWDIRTMLDVLSRRDVKIEDCVDIVSGTVASCVLSKISADVIEQIDLDSINCFDDLNSYDIPILVKDGADEQIRLFDSATSIINGLKERGYSDGLVDVVLTDLMDILKDNLRKSVLTGTPINERIIDVSPDNVICLPVLSESDNKAERQANPERVDTSETVKDTSKVTHSVESEDQKTTPVGSSDANTTTSESTTPDVKFETEIVQNLYDSMIHAARGIRSAFGW